MNYLNLIRYKNLLFIVVLMYLMRYMVIIPWLEVYSIAPQTTNLMFMLLVLATVLITAGGYVINDYFDVKIDTLNHPDKVIVGQSVSREVAGRMHQVLTGLGVLVGLGVAFWAKNFTLGIIFIMVPGLLWFYSASYKRQFLIGNLIVAFCAALVPLVALLPEATFLSHFYSPTEVELLAEYYPDILIGHEKLIETLYEWVCGFALFAFIVTLIREIIKDMEDEYGDRELECHTVPVVWGFKGAKILICSLIVFSVALLAFVRFRYITFPIDNISTRYMIFALFLPFIYLLYLVIKANRPSIYAQASTVTKIIMALGVCYSVVLYILLAINYHITIFGMFEFAAPQ